MPVKDCGLRIAGCLALGWVAAWPAVVAAQARPTQQRRNVIFILSDDHRHDCMSFVKGAPPFLRTPNLDRMTARGSYVPNAFVTTALCSPSRASILTGRYAHRHGVVDNTSPIPRGTMFFPELLQRAGYRTAYIGKWHMGEDEQSDMPRPGFDQWVSFRGQSVYVDPLLNVNGTRCVVSGTSTSSTTGSGTRTSSTTSHRIRWSAST